MPRGNKQKKRTTKAQKAKPARSDVPAIPSEPQETCARGGCSVSPPSEPTRCETCGSGPYCSEECHLVLCNAHQKLVVMAKLFQAEGARRMVDLHRRAGSGWPAKVKAVLARARATRPSYQGWSLELGQIAWDIYDSLPTSAAGALPAGELGDAAEFLPLLIVSLGESRNTLGKLQQKVQELQQNSCHNLALRRCLVALRIAESVCSKFSRELGVSLAQLATIHYQQGHYDEAMQLHQQALAIKKKISGESSASYAGSALEIKRLELQSLVRGSDPQPHLVDLVAVDNSEAANLFGRSKWRKLQLLQAAITSFDINHGSAKPAGHSSPTPKQLLLAPPVADRLARIKKTWSKLQAQLIEDLGANSHRISIKASCLTCEIASSAVHALDQAFGSFARHHGATGDTYFPVVDSDKRLFQSLVQLNIIPSISLPAALQANADDLAEYLDLEKKKLVRPLPEERLEGVGMDAEEWKNQVDTCNAALQPTAVVEEAITAVQMLQTYSAFNGTESIEPQWCEPVNQIGNDSKHVRLVPQGAQSQISRRGAWFDERTVTVEVDFCEPLPQLHPWSFYRFAYAHAAFAPLVKALLSNDGSSAHQEAEERDKQLREASRVVCKALRAGIFEILHKGSLTYRMPSGPFCAEWAAADAQQQAQILDRHGILPDKTISDEKLLNEARIVLVDFVHARVSRRTAEDIYWRPDSKLDLHQLYNNMLRTGPGSLEHVLLALHVPTAAILANPPALTINYDGQLGEYQRLRALPLPTCDKQISARCGEWKKLATSASEGWLRCECYRMAAKLAHLSYRLPATLAVCSTLIHQLEEQEAQGLYFAALDTFGKAREYIYLFCPPIKGRQDTTPSSSNPVLHKTQLEWNEIDFRLLDRPASLLGLQQDWDLDLAAQLQYCIEQIHAVRCSALHITCKSKSTVQRALVSKSMSNAYETAIRLRSIIDQWSTRLLVRTFCKKHDITVLQTEFRDFAKKERLLQGLQKALKTDHPLHFVHGRFKGSSAPGEVSLQKEDSQSGDWGACPDMTWTPQLSSSGEWTKPCVLDVPGHYQLLTTSGQLLLDFETKRNDKKPPQVQVNPPSGSLSVPVVEVEGQGWTAVMNQKLKAFFEEDDTGKEVFRVLESLQPFSVQTAVAGADPSIVCKWLPMLIAITNQAKHVSEPIPTLEELAARPQDSLLFFQLLDKAFYYHSFWDCAQPDAQAALEASKDLFKALQSKKLLNQLGYAAEGLLNAKKKQDVKAIANKIDLSGSTIVLDDLVDRLWRHRNYAASRKRPATFVKTSTGTEIQVDQDGFDLAELYIGSGDASCAQVEITRLLAVLNSELHAKGAKHVVASRGMTPKQLNTKWKNYRKKEMTLDEFLDARKDKSFRLGETFDEKALSKLMELSAQHGIEPGDQLVPRQVAVIPFLEHVVGELKRVLPELHRITNL